MVDPDRLKLYRYVTAPEAADYLAIMDRFTDALFAEWSAQDVIRAVETAPAKTAANLAAGFVCDEAMQTHGGYVYSNEHPPERAYGDIRGLRFSAGTVEAQRNVIGLRVAAGARTG